MADFDKTSPTDSSLLSQFPANERDAREAVETNFGIDHHEANDSDVGKHEIVQLLVQTTPSSVAGQGHFYTKDVGSGEVELFFQDEAGNEIQLTKGDAASSTFDSGTNMVFNQASAPTGWTQDTSLNDRVLRVVDDTGTGGSDGGSWEISGVTVDGHAITVSEMPSHNHGGSTGGDGNHNHNIELDGDSDIREGGAAVSNRKILNLDQDSGNGGDRWNTDNSGNHTHSISSQGGGSAHTHGLTSDESWRPLHRDVIAATKD